MGHTLTLFRFLFESCDTFRQLVVSSTGSSTFTTTVCCLRVCAFGFVPSGLCLRVFCPLVLLPMLVVMSRMGDIGLPFSIASDVGRYEPHGWYWVWSLRAHGSLFVQYWARANFMMFHWYVYSLGIALRCWSFWAAWSIAITLWNLYTLWVFVICLLACFGIIVSFVSICCRWYEVTLYCFECESDWRKVNRLVRTSGYGTYVNIFRIPFRELWHIPPVSGVQYWVYDLHHYGLLPSGMLPSGMMPSGMLPLGLYLRGCAFGYWVAL